MSVLELEKAVAVLSRKSCGSSAWFADFDMAQWDRQIEDDRMQVDWITLIDKAMEDYRAGKTTDL